MQRKRNALVRSIFLSVFLSTVVAGCSDPEPPVALAPLVKVIKVQESSRDQAATDTLVLADERLRRVRAELSGEVIEVLVQPGDTVRAGQALVRVNPRDARLADSAAQVQIQAAKAELATAEADFARFTRLRDQSFISQAEWERRQTSLTLARAQYEASLDRLGLYSARALADAQVSRLYVRTGQSVESGSLLVQLSPSSSAAGRQGAASSAQTRGHQSRAGLAESLWVPITAIVEGNTVMVAELRTDGQWEIRAQSVILGETNGQQIEIIQGLHPGEQIVAVGGHLLSAGQIVRVVP